ncbi:copper resistance CopC family protein [Streptosporangium lutulentum]|uniref:Methionine-rich copper-binding protein CopC n=1 Tax=Streptosporangium lutulentum TaxID=1461250 RepID=A0ABT9QA14_9ACTN|nr:copper resistance protein CopC [Streptosporangium lutulentum]MDP9842799.1 methionine-rich copper-binding protein CopC [Streptosporangium lutulentum]
MPRFIRRMVPVTLCCAVFVMLTAPAALAHDSLRSSSPAKGAEVTSVKRIELEFSAHVLFPTVALRDAAGRPVPLAKARADGPKVTAEVPETPPAGGYAIAWRVVSSDGHPIEGEIPFTVTGSAASSVPPAPGLTPASASSSPIASAAAQPGSPGSVSAHAAHAASAQDSPNWTRVAFAVLVGIGLGIWIPRLLRDRSADTK